MNTATSVVSIERDQNVVFLTFGPAATPPAAGPDETAWWPFDEADPVSGKSRAATTPIPARWSPRPVRVLSRRFARSQCAADLREWAWLVGLLAAGVICVAWLDPSIDLTPAAGGIR